MAACLGFFMFQDYFKLDYHQKQRKSEKKLGFKIGLGSDRARKVRIFLEKLHVRKVF
jgi:hypothetical protein